MIGDALYLVALPWLVLTTGGSAQELGIVLAAYSIPRALSMLVGGSPIVYAREGCCWLVSWR